MSAAAGMRRGKGGRVGADAPAEGLMRQSVQRKTLIVLAISTILGGLGIGAGFSAGALLIAEVTGNPAISGLAATMNAVGATLAGIPLARLARARGRRFALTSGNAVAVLGAVAVIFAAQFGLTIVLFAGLALLGFATAVQLQSRFSAADLSLPRHRARDISLVVWAITVGAVTGPNLIGPGAVIGEMIGIPELAGVFVFTLLAQIAAGLAVWVGLRPDPLRAALALDSQAADAARAGLPGEATEPSPPRTPTPIASTADQALVIALIAAAHAVMVALMAMTPLHIVQHGGSISLVGLTISLHVAGMYLLSPVFGMLTQRFGAIAVILGGYALLLIAALCTAFGDDSHFVIQVGLVLLGLGWSAATVAGAALLTDITPNAVRPQRQGQSDTTMNAAGAIAGVLSGIGFAIGGFPTLSVLSGVIIVLGVAVTLKLAVSLARLRGDVYERSNTVFHRKRQ